MGMPMNTPAGQTTTSGMRPVMSPNMTQPIPANQQQAVTQALANRQMGSQGMNGTGPQYGSVMGQNMRPGMGLIQGPGIYPWMGGY